MNKIKIEESKVIDDLDRMREEELDKVDNNHMFEIIEANNDEEESHFSNSESAQQLSSAY